MTVSEVPFVIHVGYPKTATTTFQKHVFPHHPDIEYLGKLIPSFRYVDKSLFSLIDELVHMSEVRYRGTAKLRAAVERLRQQTTRRCVLLSSESFIHPSTIDIAIVADRLHDAFAACKILITIREQISAILSFYRMHGRYGQYLTIAAKATDEPISHPISFSDWINLQMSDQDRNYIGTLHYDYVVRYYVKKFGAENVCVLLFEELKADSEAYANQIGGFLGVNASMLHRLMTGKHELRSEGICNAQDLAPTVDARRVSLFTRLLGTRGASSQRSAFTPTDEELNKFKDIYRAGNARLAREMSLPLQQHGYST